MHMYAKDFEILTGRELPIRGGLGQSRDDAVIIDRSLSKTPFSAAAVECAVLDLVAHMKGDDYTLIEQRLISYGDKRLDQLVIEWGEKPDRQFSFYFDITSVFKRIA